MYAHSHNLNISEWKDKDLAPVSEMNEKQINDSSNIINEGIETNVDLFQMQAANMGDWLRMQNRRFQW